MGKLETFFAGWDAPMVQACLQGHMGRVRTAGEDNALASIGDFCFLAGEPSPEMLANGSEGRGVSPELLELTDAPILIPGNGAWEELIREALGERAVPFTRFATRREPECFNRDRLIRFTRLLPKGFAFGLRTAGGRGLLLRGL